MAKGPLASEERLEIVEALRRGNLSHRALAQQFNRSQSTISGIAKDAGISSSHRRKRTPAAKDLESTYSREERIRFEDRILGVLDEMVAAGGLSPREVREVAQAAKVALDARRSEDGGDRLGDEKAEKSNQTFVKVGLGDLAVDPNTDIGRELLELNARAGDPELEQHDSNTNEEYSAGEKSPTE